MHRGFLCRLLCQIPPKGGTKVPSYNFYAGKKQYAHTEKNISAHRYIHITHTPTYTIPPTHKDLHVDTYPHVFVQTPAVIVHVLLHLSISSLSLHPTLITHTCIQDWRVNTYTHSQAIRGEEMSANTNTQSFILEIAEAAQYLDESVY